MRRIRSRLTYANVMVDARSPCWRLAGGAAYAANTVFSADIVNGEVKSADIGSGEVRSADVRDEALAGRRVATGADIANTGAGGSDDVDADLLDGADSRGLVRGRGRLLGARFIMQPGQPDRTLFAIPDLGRLDAHCEETVGRISLSNTTNFDLDWWHEAEGFWYTGVLHPSGALSRRGALSSTVRRSPSDSATIPEPEGQRPSKHSPSRWAAKGVLAYSRRRRRTGPPVSPLTFPALPRSTALGGQPGRFPGPGDVVD